MSKNNTVRIILKRTNRGGHGELISEEFKTVEIFSEEIESLLVGDSFSGGFSVIGSELIDPLGAKKRHDPE